jgi:hypothetical protein
VQFNAVYFQLNIAKHLLMTAPLMEQQQQHVQIWTFYPMKHRLTIALLIEHDRITAAQHTNMHN